VDQFSKQASPFAELHIHMDAMDLLLEMSGVDSGNTVLDVACGPGLVACEFAPRASRVTGIDITEASSGCAGTRIPFPSTTILSRSSLPDTVFTISSIPRMLFVK
jgi:ubiquinone/menaquinone biosynthesis C-methylase UbiE